MNQSDIALFALNATREFGEKVSQALALPLSQHEEREFEAGEHKARPLVNVRNKDVYVIQSLHGDANHSANDKLCRLLFFIGALKDAAAARVTAFAPYLCYSRKDRKTKSRDPVTTRYVAALFEAVGCDRFVTLDVHNLAAFQNAFRCHTEHLEAKTLFVRHFVPLVGESQVAVVSPDVGGAKRAEQFRQALSRALDREISTAFVEKYRSSGVVSGQAIVGDVQGRVAIIIDDMICGGTTMARAAEACRSKGATRVYVAASHGLFTEKANRVLATPALDRIAIADCIPPFRLTSPEVLSKLDAIATAPLVAEAIRRMHEGGSLVDLLDPPSSSSVS